MNIVVFFQELITNPTNLVSWILFGLIVGTLVHLIDPGDVRGGIIGTVILGVFGALLGGLATAWLLGIALVGFSLQGLIVAVIGALILALISRLVFRRTGVFTTTTRTEQR